MAPAPGRRLAAALFGLGLVLVIQTGLAVVAAERATTTMWIHVPLGVALVGLALWPGRLARQLAHHDLTPSQDPESIPFEGHRHESV